MRALFGMQISNFRQVPSTKKCMQNGINLDFITQCERVFEFSLRYNVARERTKRIFSGCWLFCITHLYRLNCSKMFASYCLSVLFVAWIAVCSGDDVVVQIISKNPINYISDKYVSYSVDPIELLEMSEEKEWVEQ